MHRAQNQTHTHLFRRTDVLTAARAELDASGTLHPRILSFGCSTGEEIVTIRHLFPQAGILGCEIDPGIRTIAQRSVGHLSTVFDSSAEAIAAHGPFDLIVCSATLCLNPPAEIGSRFPSSQFDESLAILDAALAPSGLLALTNASYRLQDSCLAETYEPVRSDIVWSSGFVDVFAHDGHRFLSRIPRHPQPAFRRGPAFALRDPEELADSLFRKGTQGLAGAPPLLRLAPVPGRFACTFEFSRSNLDGLSAEGRRNAIDVVKHYRFGTDEASGQRGCSLQISWDCGEGAYRRPPFWIPLGDDVLTEW
jgi:hypothetical protein